MVDLRTAASQLIENPLVPVPPVEGVVARARRYRAQRLRRQAGASVALVALVVTAVVRAGIGGGGPDSLRVVGDPVTGDVAASIGADASVMVPLPPEPSSRHATATDYGDSGWDRLPARGSCPTKVDPALDPIPIMVNASAPQPSEHELPPVAVVQSVVAYYNHLGGICGHLIQLVDHPLSASIPGDVVALVGSPLDPDLDDGIASGRFAKLGLPVVGDGLTRVQHHARTAFPVGTSAEALARIALDRAASRGARTFAIVYDGGEAFGREAFDSFARYTARLGGSVRESINLSEAGVDLVSAADRFRQACEGKRCDFVLLALKAATGEAWLQTRPPVARVETTALPTLLTGGVPESCFRTRNERCDGLTAWTGFTPWFEQNRHLEDLDGEDLAFELSAVKGGAMTEATAVSARATIHALMHAGPTVTRDTLRTTLEAMTFSPEPGVVVQWGGGLPRAGNSKAQRWRMDVEPTQDWAADGTAYAQDEAAPEAAWLGAVATWAQGAPRWSEALAAHGADVEATTRWLADTGEWVDTRSKALSEKLQAWSTTDLPVPSAHGVPLPPPLPQPEPAPMMPDRRSPNPPLPDKWWSAEGDWWGDPG